MCVAGMERKARRVRTWPGGDAWFLVRAVSGKLARVDGVGSVGRSGWEGSATCSGGLSLPWLCFYQVLPVRRGRPCQLREVKHDFVEGGSGRQAECSERSVDGDGVGLEEADRSRAGSARRVQSWRGWGGMRRLGIVEGRGGAEVGCPSWMLGREARGESPRWEGRRWRSGDEGEARKMVVGDI
jgi:hypothetical protein